VLYTGQVCCVFPFWFVCQVVVCFFLLRLVFLFLFCCCAGCGCLVCLVLAFVFFIMVVHVSGIQLLFVFFLFFVGFFWCCGSGALSGLVGGFVVVVGRSRVAGVL